jgi:hypothetical protein
MTRIPAFVLTAGLGLTLSGAAFAGAGGSAAKVWVASTGVDAAGCGAVASPCRTLQYAHDNIAAPGGAIYVKDAASYGLLSITHAITIINDSSGTASITATAGEPGIKIAAGASDAVVLKGLTVNNTPGANNTNGVWLVSAASVSLDHMTITGMNFNGVNIAPTTSMKVSLTNSLIENNGSNGVSVYPSGSANVAIEATGLVVDNNGHTYNGNGFYVDGDNTSGTIFVLYSNSTANFNQQVGFGGDGARVTLTMTRSTGTGNAEGAEIYNGNSGVPTAYTYGDNRFKGNTITDSSGFTSVSGQ